MYLSTRLALATADSDRWDNPTVGADGARLPTFMHNGERWIAMRPVVEAIGLNWKGQHAKLLADKDKFSCVDIHTPDGRGHKQVMTCILVSKFALWLASINPAKIPDPDKRARIELYQAECATALHQFWTTGAAIRDGDRIVGADEAPIPGVIPLNHGDLFCHVEGHNDFLAGASAP